MLKCFIMKEKLWTKSFLILLLLGIFKSTAFTMIMPVITKHVIGFGATLTMAGVIAGLFAFAALVTRPVTGMIADRTNRKYLLLTSSICMCLATFLYSVAGTVELFIPARILHGAAFSFSGTVTIAFAASLIPKSRLGEGLGYLGITHIIAMAVGPALGIFLGEKYGFNATFLSACVLLIIAILIILLLPNPGTTITEKSKINLKDFVSFKLLPLAIISGLFSLFNGIVASFLVLLGDERGILNIGLYFTVNAMCLLFVRPLAGKLIDRTSLGVVLIPCLLIAAVAAVLLGAAASIGMIIFAAVLKAISQGSGQPAVQTVCMKMLPPEKSGLAASTFFIGADIGQGVGPILGGMVSSSWGYNIMFYSCAVLLLCGVIIFITYSAVQKKKQESL